jgi:hypothetical protein
MLSFQAIVVNEVVAVVLVVVLLEIRAEKAFEEDGGAADKGRRGKENESEARDLCAGEKSEFNTNQT